jgi:hypothetical protein
MRKGIWKSEEEGKQRQRRGMVRDMDYERDKRGTFVPWSLDRVDHCDCCSDDKNSRIAGWEISSPDVWRRD